ncbi:MAG: diacylglycerol kinase family protein [Clostridia bacterium]|nr:diacylglycerol kinase family protein [Clostridia bacterium]
MEFGKFLKSFTYAFSGVKHCLKTERNLRFHLTFLTYMFTILLSTDWFVLSRSDYAVLITASALVVTAEVINTAVENSVNLASEEKSEYGRIAKDAAAGAVLVAAVFAIITGFVIMFQIDAFKAMFAYFTANPLMFLLLLLSLIPAVIFIFQGNPFSKGKKK